MENLRKLGKYYIKHIDKPLFFSVLAAVCYGLVIVSSATQYLGSNSKLITQAAAVIIGFTGMFFVSAFDYENYKELWKITYPISLLLMLYTAFFGVTVNGNKNWLNLKVTMFQPSELVKLVFIVTLAYVLDKYKSKIFSLKGLLSVALVYLPLAVTLLLQKDTGTLVVYTFILAVMLFCCGIHWIYFAAAGVVLALSAPLVWTYVLRQNIKDRILVMFNPYLDPLGKGYQVILARNMLGSGGWFGQGLYKGLGTQNGNLPGRQTDFILACVGEELGFVGVLLVLIILGLISFFILRIAIKTNDTFGKLICIGVFSMFVWQIFCNVGMNVSLMPVIGVTLPFFSYGGSSMMTSLFAIGLVLSIKIKRKPLDFSEY